MQCPCISDTFNQINSTLDKDMNMTAALKEVFALNREEDEEQNGMIGVIMAYHLFDIIAAKNVSFVCVLLFVIEKICIYQVKETGVIGVGRERLEFEKVTFQPIVESAYVNRLQSVDNHVYQISPKDLVDYDGPKAEEYSKFCLFKG